MRWLSLSSIRSWKKLKLQHPSILSSCNPGNHYDTSSCLLSTSAAARATASDYRKSNPVEGYIQTIRSQKWKSCRGFLPDIIGLSRLMKSYSKIGCTEYGSGVLGLILKLGYTPRVIDINIFMNALCQQLRINEAALLFQKMKTHLGCTPSIVTYGTLLKGLCSTGNSRIALNLHERIADGTHVFSGDLQLDLICYNTLIDGLCKDGLIDKAKELFLEMNKKDVSPDVITYNIVIGGMCRAGMWEESQAMYHEMLDQGLSPSIVTFNVLINALAKMGKGKEANELFLLMIQSGQMPSVVTYNSLMDCMYREGNIEELKEVFISMDRRGITPDVVSYSILIKGYCKHGMIHEANEAYRRMIHKGAKPDIITINALLEGMLLKGMVSEAIELKSEITVHNLTPNICTYNILVDGFCKNGYIQEAVKLFDKMSDSKLKLDVVTYNSLIDGLCKDGKLEKALLLFDRMSSDGVLTDVTTYSILINGLCKSEKIIEAEKLFVDMEKMISDTNKVIELLQMMAHRQVKLDDAIDDMVITQLLKEEKYHEYLNLLPTFPQREVEAYLEVVSLPHLSFSTGALFTDTNISQGKVIGGMDTVYAIKGRSWNLQWKTKEKGEPGVVIRGKKGSGEVKVKKTGLALISGMAISSTPVGRLPFSSFGAALSISGVSDGPSMSPSSVADVGLRLVGVSRGQSVMGVEAARGCSFGFFWWGACGILAGVKRLKLPHPPIIGSSSSGKHNEMCFSLHMLSSFSVARVTASDQPKSNYIEGYIENIKSHKSKSRRGMLTDLFSLSRLMKSYSKIGVTAYGFGVLGLVLKLGYTMNNIGISSLMHALCNELRINDAALLFQKMKTNLGCTPDIVTYGVLLKGLCSTGNSRIALNLHEQIADGTHDLSGVLQMNFICYSTLIDGLCKDGFIDKAKELFLEMKKKDISPNVITYNIVIGGLCRAGKWEEAQAMSHTMLDQGLEPSVVTFNVLINALAKMGKSKEAKQLFLLMIQSGKMPNVVTYNSLMDCFYGEGNIEELKEVFVSMERKGITPDVVSYSILIKGYCKHGMIHEASEEYQRMIQKGVKPSIITINALLEGMLLKGMVNEAIALKSEIRVYNLTPNICTYNILVDGFCKNGFIQEAVKLFDMVSDSKLKPNVITYSSLIDGLCKAGKLEKALLLFDRMSSDSVVPNVITYNSLIDGLCKAGKLDKALLLFDRMPSDSVVPNGTTYNILISGLCVAEKFMDAEKFFVDMEKSGIPPDLYTFGALIHGYCKISDTHKVMELLQMMAHRQLKLNDVIDDMVITQLLKEEKYHEFLNLLPTFPQRIPPTVH
ncbi:unnamed protein product [Rhodiola kirilowii]